LNPHSNIKELTVQLRVLLNDVIDYNWGSFFGVRAMDPDVLRLWKEYNQIRSEFILNKKISPLDFPEMAYPNPDIADSECFFKGGTMIYKPEHFATLRLTIEKMLTALSSNERKESA